MNWKSTSPLQLPALGIALILLTVVTVTPVAAQCYDCEGTWECNNVWGDERGYLECEASEYWQYCSQGPTICLWGGGGILVMQLDSTVTDRLASGVLDAVRTELKLTGTEYIRSCDGTIIGRRYVAAVKRRMARETETITL